MANENIDYKKMFDDLMAKLSESEKQGTGSNGYGYQNQGNAQQNRGLFGSFASTPASQFLIGALVGGAAAYVLSNPEIRARIMKFLASAWTGVAGGFEELKEQMADAQAERNRQEAAKPE